MLRLPVRTSAFLKPAFQWIFSYRPPNLRYLKPFPKSSLLWWFIAQQNYCSPIPTAGLCLLSHRKSLIAHQRRSKLAFRRRLLNRCWIIFQRIVILLKENSTQHRLQIGVFRISYSWEQSLLETQRICSTGCSGNWMIENFRKTSSWLIEWCNGTN